MKESHISVKKVLVTPSQAQAWLLKNTINRPLSRTIVNYYVNLIKSNAWECSTDAVGFDTEGNLINGQHRLTAIAESGKPQEMLVGHGFAKDAFNVIDTGKKRTAGDILGAHGLTGAHSKSSIIKFVMAYKKGYIGVGSSKFSAKRNVAFTNQSVLDFAEKNSDKLQEAYEIACKTSKSFKGIKSRVAGGVYWLLSDVNRDHAMLFMHQLATGVGLKRDDAIYLLREKMISDMASRKKFPERDKVAWIILAWNNMRKGNKVKKIQWAGGEALPKPI